MRKITALAVIVAMTIATGCTTITRGTSFNGCTDFDGKSVNHLNVSKIGVNILINRPLIDGSLDSALDALTQQAKTEGKNQVRIVQSKENAWWFIFPPFSLVICPVFSGVAADVR